MVLNESNIHQFSLTATSVIHGLEVQVSKRYVLWQTRIDFGHHAVLPRTPNVVKSCARDTTTEHICHQCKLVYRTVVHKTWWS